MAKPDELMDRLARMEDKLDRLLLAEPVSPEAGPTPRLVALEAAVKELTDYVKRIVRKGRQVW